MAISLQYFVKYVADTVKLSRQAEKSVKALHVLHWRKDDDTDHIEAVVQASLTDCSYDVTVSILI